MRIWNLAYSITNRCNLRCKHCYANSGNVKNEELNTKEINKWILEESNKCQTRFITLTGGEPLMRKDIFDVIANIKNHKIGVCLATNGIMLDKDLIKKLKELQVERVQISLEGSSAELNDLIRGEGTYDKLVGYVIPELKKNGLFTAVSVTPTINNIDDVDNMADLCNQIRVDSLSFRRFNPVGRGRENCLELQNGNKEYLERIYNIRRKYEGKLKISTGDPLFATILYSDCNRIDSDVFGGCTAGVASIAIDAVGNIKPCTRSDTVLANVKSNALSEVWNNNEILNKLRNRNSLNPKCKNCQYIMLCGGCRVAAYEKYGDFFAEDPKCWLKI